MAKSLQDQLMNAGLIDKKKAKNIQKEQRKTKKLQGKGHEVVDENKILAQKTLKEKSERDRLINQQRNEEAEKKAIFAQIKQLIDTHKIDRSGGEISYQFNDGGSVKKINITKLLQSQLVAGLIAIARHGEYYALVPKVVANKVCDRDPSFIILLNEKESSVENEDDPYADYQIPDDLMW